MNPRKPRTREKNYVSEGKDFKATPSKKSIEQKMADDLKRTITAPIRVAGAAGHVVNQFVDYSSKQIQKAVKDTIKGEDPVKLLTNAFNQATSKKKNVYNQPLRDTLKKINKK